MTTIVFETPWKHLFDGWCTASRAYARAMALAGVDVHLKAWDTDPYTPLDPAVAREIPESMREPISKWDAHVFSTPLGGPANHRRVGTFEFFHRLNKPPRLLYTMFERRNVQAELIDEFNRLDGVWVPCRENANILSEAGCKNVIWVRYPYFDDDPHFRLPPPSPQPRVFLWMGRWEPRKAPHNLVRAFLRAFKPGEARLILKLGPSPWATQAQILSGSRGYYADAALTILAELEQVKGWTREDAVRDIEIVEGKLAADEMLRLHARSDVYVSASRGEGIDLPAFAAKLAGRRIITTNSGGPQDFLGEGDIVVPRYGTIEAPEYDWLWGEGSVYADYMVEDLVCAMQGAMKPVKASPVPPSHEAERVGIQLANWIEEKAARYHQ